MTWVFFRAADFGEASAVLTGMVGGNAAAPARLPLVDILAVCAITVGLVGTHWAMRDRPLSSVLASVPRPVLAAGWALMILAVMVEQGQGNAFIYFQF